MDISLSEITNLTPIVFRKGEVIEKMNENLPGREGVNGKATEPPREWIEDIISLGAEMPDGQADVLSGKVPLPEADFFPPAGGEAGSEGAAVFLPEDAYTPAPPDGHGGTLPVLEGMYTPAGKKILPQPKNGTSPLPAQAGEAARPAPGSPPASELGRSIYRNALSAYAALAGSKAPPPSQSTVTVVLPSTGNIPAPAEAALPVEPSSDNFPENTAEFSSGGGFETALPFSAGEDAKEAVPLPQGEALENSAPLPQNVNSENAAPLSGAPANKSAPQVAAAPPEGTPAFEGASAFEEPVPLSNSVLFEPTLDISAEAQPVEDATAPFEVPSPVFSDAAPQPISGGRTLTQLFGSESMQNDPLLSALLMDDGAAFTWLEGEGQAQIQAQPPTAGMARDLFAGLKQAPPPAAPNIASTLTSAALAAEVQPSEILLRNIKLNAGGVFLSPLMRDASVFAPEAVREHNKKQTKELPYSLYLFGGANPEGLKIADEEYEEDEPEAKPDSPDSDYLRVSDAIKMAAIVHNLYFGEHSAFLEGTPWYQVYVDYALLHHIISEGEYSDPGEYVTRAEMASIFACAVPRSELAPRNNLPAPADVPLGRSRELIALLLRAGVLAKRSAGAVFNPDGYVTRTEASVIMGRIVNPALRK